jgi:hypothetical protein
VQNFLWGSMQWARFGDCVKYCRVARRPIRSVVIMSVVNSYASPQTGDAANVKAHHLNARHGATD